MPLRTSAAVTATVLAVALVLSGAPPSHAAPPALDTPTVVDTPAGRLEETTIPVVDRSGRSLAPGRDVEVDVPDGTQMVGLTWAPGAAAPVEVQVRGGADGRWGDWVDLHDDAADDGGAGRPGAGPVWLGREGADAVGLRVVTGDPRGLEVTALTVRGAPTTRAATVDHPATPAGGPPIHTRAAWAPGGWQGHRDGCPSAPVAMDALRFGVVHHTVNANSYGTGDVAGILAGIYRFHTSGRGWCDIAYSYFVDRFGRVWEGRSGGLDHPIWGGHTKGFNWQSVGVALLGQHHPGETPAAAPPTAAALEAARDVLAWKLGSHGVDPMATVSITSGGSPRFPAGRVVRLPTVQGHRHTGLTSCPGDLLHERLPAMRSEAAARIAATATPSRWVPATTGAAFFGELLTRATGEQAGNGVAGTYTSMVTRSGWPRDPLATALVLSPGTDARIGSVGRLYRAAFRRHPETAGLRYWVAERDRAPLAGIARRFTVTPEFRDRYDHLDDLGFAAGLYRNVLGRAPDAPGLAYWLDRLAGGTPRHEVLLHLSESAEHRSRTAVDGEVTRTYLVLFDRAPAPDERAAWRTHYGGGGSGTSMVTFLVRSREYAEQPR